MAAPRGGHVWHSHSMLDENELEEYSDIDISDNEDVQDRVRIACYIFPRESDMTIPHRDNIEGEYEGDWEEGVYGKMCGHGSWKNGRGKSYVGEWYDGQPHGKGKLIWPSGKWYEGDFVGAQAHGNGTLHFGPLRSHGGVGPSRPYEGGSTTVPMKYTGEFRYGQRHGKGICVFGPVKSIYEGDWRNNRRHGFGKMTYAFGEVYEGGWARNTREGKGRLAISMIGQVYEAEFVENHPFGKGKIYYLKTKKVAAADWGCESETYGRPLKVGDPIDLRSTARSS